MPEEEEVTANMKAVAPKVAEGKTIESMPDVYEIPSSQGGQVPVPYPNTAKSSDISSGSKTVKIGEKEVMTKSSSKKSTGDEPSQSSWKSINKVIKTARFTKILNVPLWIWGFGSIVLLVAFWIIVSNIPHPTEPIEHYIIELIASAK